MMQTLDRPVGSRSGDQHAETVAQRVLITEPFIETLNEAMQLCRSVK
jgi:hypothetical protein